MPKQEATTHICIIEAFTSSLDGELWAAVRGEDTKRFRAIVRMPPDYQRRGLAAGSRVRIVKGEGEGEGEWRWRLDG